MLSYIMVDYTTKEHIESCERIIQSYLSDLNKIDIWMNTKNGGMKDDNRKPIWFKKYNFQSLINVPATMKKFGPLRNYWEGSMQGEGYLKVVKPKINPNPSIGDCW